ncbi:hypothetical protein [Shinella sp.]|uniref:hypothetical protein n=1 Tax=Shinella sp. TaxID=1870904 RepID=UPI003F7001DD
MDQVEKVARAICQAEGFDPDKDWRGQKETEPYAAWKVYTTAAKAALAVMAEQAEEEPKSVAWEFVIGQFVEKFTGEVIWHGIVVARYKTTSGKRRYVAEVLPQGFQMIVAPEQLRRLDDLPSSASPETQSDGFEFQRRAEGIIARLKRRSRT